MLTSLFRDEDAQALFDCVPEMMQTAAMANKQFVRPTSDELVSVRKTILEFVSKKERKMTGSWAHNMAMLLVVPESARECQKGDDDALQFFSPDPVGDVINLTDKIYSEHGFKYVQAREGRSHISFKITVEFACVCIVWYAPSRVFNSIPIMSGHHWCSGIGSQVQMPMPIVVSPIFQFNSYLRVLNDPFTSYWKLDTVLPRLMELQRAFPMILEFPQGGGGGNEQQTIPMSLELALLIEWAAGHPTCASVGDHARLFFASAAGIELSRTIRQLALVSVDYVTDLVDVVRLLKTVCGGEGLVKVQEFNELTDMLGRRAIIRVGGETILNMIDAAGRAVPVIDKAPDGLLVAGFTYCVANTLAMWFLASMNRSNAQHYHSCLLHDMLRFRSSNLSATATDPSSPFRDIQLSYIGEPKTEMQVHMDMVNLRRRAANGNYATMWLSYDPTKPKARPFKYRLPHCDGSRTPPKHSVMASVVVV